MRIDELELYYFEEKSFQKIREKHFGPLKELIGIEELFNNQDLTDALVTIDEAQRQALIAAMKG